MQIPNVSCDIKEINNKIDDIILKETQFFKDKRLKLLENEGNNNKNIFEISNYKLSAYSGTNLDDGFISNKKKTTSMFSCCSKFLQIFKKKKKYNDFERNNQN